MDLLVASNNTIVLNQIKEKLDNKTKDDARKVNDVCEFFKSKEEQIKSTLKM